MQLEILMSTSTIARNVSKVFSIFKWKELSYAVDSAENNEK